MEIAKWKMEIESAHSAWEPDTEGSQAGRRGVKELARGQRKARMTTDSPTTRRI